MLKGGFADAPLAVQQEAVIRQCSLDVSDEVASAVEEITPNHSAGDVGIELLGDGALGLQPLAEVEGRK